MLSILVPSAAAKKVMARLLKLTRTAGVDVAPVPGVTTLIKDDRVLECARYTIGEMPRLAGYKFAARLQHEADGNIVARAPDERQGENLESVFGIDNLFDFRTAPNKCEHCNVARRRKETFVLRDPSGQLIQIGRQCLADFLQCDPTQMIAIAEAVAELSKLTEETWDWDGYGYWGAHGEESTAAFVAFTVASVALRGFVKASGSENDLRDRQSTRSHVEWLMRPLFGEKPQHVIDEWNAGQPTAEDREKVVAMLEWAKSQGEGAGEYLWNLRVAAGRLGVGKNAGILASLPSAYGRAMGIEAERSNKPEPPREGFAAEAGWIWKGVAMLVRRNMTEIDFGAVAICTFRSTDGFEIVWFASGNAPREADVGASFELKGRVKRCDVRKGVHQTIISRATWKPIEAVA